MNDTATTTEEAPPAETPVETPAETPAEAPVTPNIVEGRADPAPIRRNQTDEQLLIGRLKQENEGLRALLGTLLYRNNDTLILLRKHREGYFAKVDRHGHPPQLNINHFGKHGDLKIEAVWSQAAQQTVTEEEPGPTLGEITEALAQVGVGLPGSFSIKGWSFEQKVEVLNWAGAVAAKQGGVEIEVPPRPPVLEGF